MTGNEAAILAEGVRIRRGERDILSGVSLRVDRGEVVGILGPNGAGKSTLLSALAGDLATSGGSVTVDGCPVASTPVRVLARHRAVLTQHNAVSFAFRAQEIVAMGRSPWRGVSAPEEDLAACREAVAHTDIEHLLDRPFHHLSGGERARVSLARVLAQATPVVLLDEPTAALDVHHQESVMAVARRTAERGRAVVAVLHDLSLAAAWCDRVVLIAGGGVRRDAPPAEALDAAVLEEVYGCPMQVFRAPDGSPVVVPRRG